MKNRIASDMNSVEELYRRYVALTGDAQAAATLVLAESNFQGRPRPVEEMLSVKEVAARLRIDACSVYDLVRTGRLPHIRVGKAAIRVTAGDLASLNAKPPAPDPTAYVPTHLPVRRPRGRPESAQQS